MEPVTNSDLKPTSKPRTIGNPIIRVRTGRRLDRVVIAAKIMAIEGVEHIDQHRGGLLRREANVLLQSKIEVLIPEHVTKPKECTSRRLVDVWLLLADCPARACVGRWYSDSGSEIHNSAESEIGGKPEHPVGDD